MIATRLSVVWLLVVLAFPGGAQPFELVDVGSPDGCFFESLSAQEAEFVPDGPEIIGYVAAAPAPGGRIYAVTWRTHGTFEVSEIRPDGTFSSISPSVSGWEPFNIVVDRNGAIFVLANPCSSLSACPEGAPDAILAFKPNGVLEAIHPLAPGFANDAGAAMDLAADQCTIFLIQDEMVIRRFNVCTGSFLPDFATLAGFGNALRILPDGGVLVGTDRDAARYSAAGALVRTYPMDRSGAIGLSEGGRRAWITERCARRFVELDLESGNVYRTGRIGLMRPTSMIPYNGWSAALAAHLGQSVPAMAEVGLVALGALLAFAAFLRLR